MPGELKSVVGVSYNSLNKSTNSMNGSSYELAPNVKVSRNVMDKQWEDVQRKTFTKWVNNQLDKKSRPQVETLAKDFSNGVPLLELLEIIGDASLGKYYKNPKHRVQKCENLNRALDFIKSRNVNLTNIGAEDIVDGNEKLVLGLVWTLILRFSIAEISEEGKSAKDGLLLWCQRKTAGYRHVDVKDFTFSWADGLAFCALIHCHRPDLLNFDSLDPSKKRENVKLAFDIAENCLGIKKLLDVEDLVDIAKPDERSVMTYVAQYFHAFTSLDKDEVAGRRVGKFASVIKSTWEMQNDYEKRASALLKSISEITESWSLSIFDGSYSDAKRQSVEFQEYKNSSKRTWVSEKRELDTLLSNINTKLATYKLALYTPPEGFGSADVDGAWRSLIEAEGVRRKLINGTIREIKEKLKVNYSNLANTFENILNDLSIALGSVSGDLKQQLDAVKKISEQLDRQEQVMEEIHAADDECNKASIDEIDREYTVYSVEDLEFDLGLVRMAIKKKQAFIENQVVARSMTNLTPQQLEEFDTAFKAFDKDNSNCLQFTEFKACLNSLGKDYDDAEFEKIFRKVSNNGESVKFEQFSKFMVSITEDRTSPEQLLEAFKDICEGKEYITDSDLRRVQVAPDQVEYLKSVMPVYQSTGDGQVGYDYRAYLVSVFQ